MTKRITACFISIIMIITSLVISASDKLVLTENDGRIILSTGFDNSDLTFNSSVLYIDSKGESVSLRKNGYMNICKNTKGTDPYFDVDLSTVSPEGIVFSADFKTGDSAIVADLFKMRYSDNSMVSLLSLGEDNIVRCMGKTITTLSAVKMTNIAVFLKNNGYYEVYADDELKTSGSTGKTLSWQFIRCQILPDNLTGSLGIDNLKIYSAATFGEEAEIYIINNDFNDEKNYKDGFVRIVAGSGNSILCEGESSLEIITEDNTKDPYMDVFIPDNDTFSSLVFSADFTVEKLGAKTNIFQLRNDKKQYLTDVFITEAGNIYQHSNKIAEVSEGEKVNIALVYNVTESSYDVYINEEKKVSGAKSSYSGAVERMRIQVLPNYGTGTLSIDNLKVYEGEEICDVADTGSISGWSVLPDARTDKVRLGEAVAYHTASDYAFYNGEKHLLPARPYVKNKEIYIPGEIVFPITGAVGEDMLLSELCERHGKEFFCDDTGLIVITDGEFPYKDNRAVTDSLSTYLFSHRPDKAEIENLFTQSGNNSVHPRIMATQEDFDYFKQQRNTDTYMSDWIENIIYRADNMLLTLPCEYKLQEYRLNAVVSVVLERITTLGFAYRVTEDVAYAQRALEEMEKVMTYPDWNSQHFLDTAELTFAMAIGYDWCYEYLEKERKTDEVVKAIVTMGLNEGDKQYRGYVNGTSFIFQDMNWNSVCNAGMTAGALAIMEKEPEFCAGIVKNAIRSIEYMLPAFSPDGGWQEGTGYWEYAFSYLVKMAECLKSVLGTDFDIPMFTDIENSVMYRIAMQGSTYSNNYHDSSETKDVNAEILWAGKYFDRTDFSSYYLSRIKNTVQNDELWRCIYYDRKTSVNQPYSFPRDMMFKNLEAVSMRSSYTDENATFLSFHAGDNSVNHRQFDAGTFVLDMIGERWASDLGTEPLSYLGVASKNLYRVRPEGHNTLVINPSEQIGQESKTDCPVTKLVSEDSGAYAVTDLTSAYLNQADSVVRGFMLTDGRRTVVIRDEIVVKESSQIYWFMHTGADISIVDNNTAILTIGNKSVQMKVVVEGADAELYSTDATPFEATQSESGQADNSAFRKVAIKLTGSGAMSISVRITPLDEPFAEADFVPKEISSWSIDEDSFSPEDYSRQYIIHSELFDNEINSPTSIYTLWQMRNGDGSVGGMIQSKKNSITRETAIGSKGDDDGCIVVKTENLTTQTGIDPFVQIECNDATKGNVTFEFQVYADGEQTVYVQLIDSNSATKLLMEMKPDGMAYISGIKAAPAERGKWHDVAITLRGNKKTADIYINGKLVKTGISASTDVKRIKIISLYQAPAAGEARNGLTAIDNVRVYMGEKENYYYALFANGEKTEDVTVADEIYVNISDEAGLKGYFVSASTDGSTEGINVINPGEDMRFKLQPGKKGKLLIWDKYSLYPEKMSITTGGNSNE